MPNIPDLNGAARKDPAQEVGSGSDRHDVFSRLSITDTWSIVYVYIAGDTFLMYHGRLETSRDPVMAILSDHRNGWYNWAAFWQGTPIWYPVREWT